MWSRRALSTLLPYSRVSFFNWQFCYVTMLRIVCFDDSYAALKLLKIFCTTERSRWVNFKRSTELSERGFSEAIVTQLFSIDKPKPWYVHLFSKDRFGSDLNQKDLLMPHILISNRIHSHSSSNNAFILSLLWAQSFDTNAIFDCRRRSHNSPCCLFCSFDRILTKITSIIRVQR